MAFVPNLKDFDEDTKNAGFRPSLKDFEESPREDIVGNLSRLAAIPKNLLISGAQEAVKGIKGLASLPEIIGLKNPLSSSYEIAGLGKNPYALNEYQVPGYEEIKETPEAKIAEYSSEYAPLLGLGTYGGLKAASKIRGSLPGNKAIKKAEEFVRNVTGTRELSRLHEPVLNEIRSNYAKVKTKENELWNDIKETALKRGYSGIPEGISRHLGEKTSNLSIKAPQSLDRIETLETSDPFLKKSVENFKERPSYENAHKLQYRLRQVGDALARSPDAEKRSLSKFYSGARNKLISEIESTFEKNGHPELVDKLKQAREFTKKEAVPYTKNRALHAVVKKEGIEEVNPQNIGKTLSSDDAAVRKIVEGLSPESRRFILGSRIKPSITETEKLGRRVDVNKLLKQASNIRKSEFGKFLTEDQRNLLAQIEKHKLASERLRKGIKYGSPIVAGILGLERLSRLFA